MIGTTTATLYQCAALAHNYDPLDIAAVPYSSWTVGDLLRELNQGSLVVANTGDTISDEVLLRNLPVHSYTYRVINRKDNVV